MLNVVVIIQICVLNSFEIMTTLYKPIIYMRYRRKATKTLWFAKVTGTPCRSVMMLTHDALL